MGKENNGIAALLRETRIQQEIRLACSRGPVRLWRNNSGSLPDPLTRRYVQFGVGNPGGSDLIGYRKVAITPEMVGTEIAVFAAVEVKAAKGKVTEQQKAFIEHIRNAGGIAGVARSVDEAKSILLS
jgi:hypothetical protein